MKLQKIIDILQSIAQDSLAEEWDNVGLMIGDKDQEIDKILIALDFNSLVLDEAINLGANLIITHHPAIFNPLKRIIDKNYIKAIKNDISVYSMHTNLDNAEDGVNYVFADLLELYNCSQSGMIRYGETEEKTLEEFAEFTKEKFNVQTVRIAGNMNKKIKKVAVLGGSGGSMIDDVINLGVDLYVTGECAYNYAQTAYENDLALIVLGHFETENPVIYKLKDMLSQRIDQKIFVSKTENIYKLF